MLSHRRGRSLSEALTLDELEDGGVVISSINNSASSNRELKEGDEILGATINFDQLSKEEVLEVLKLMEPFDDKVQVLTRNNLSKSLGNLDQCAKTPEAMLNDSYNKLYNAKVRRFMKGELPDAEEGYVNGDFTGKPTAPGSSKVNLKHDMGLPRLGVDFGLLKSRTLSTDSNANSQFVAGELTDGSNLNLPPFGLGLNGTSLNETQEPKLKLHDEGPQLNIPDLHLSEGLPKDPNINATAGLQLPNTDSSSVDLAMPNLKRPQIGLESNRTEAPEIATNLKGVSTPEMGLNFDGGNITGPSVNAGIPQLSIEGTNKDLKMPAFKTPDLDLSGPQSQYSMRLKNPDLNVDDPYSYVESPKLRLSGRSPDLDLEMPDINTAQRGVNGTDIGMPPGDVKMSLKKPKSHLKAPDLDVDAPSGIFTSPKFGFSGKSEADVKTPKMKGEISTPDINLPKAGLKGLNLASDTPSVGIEGPSGKYKAPKFAMPKFDLPDIEVPSVNGDLEGPDFKGTIAHPNFDVNVPSANFNIKSPSGKLEAPGFGTSGLKVERPGYELQTPEMDVSAPKFKGDFNLSGVDLTDPKLKLNTSDINMPSGKFHIDANAPSVKPKLPKFKLFGTLSKKKDLELSGPKLKGFDGKVKTPDFDLPSPKFKGVLGSPDLNLNTDLKSPDLSLKSPKIKGEIDAPDLDLPNMDLKAPKFDVNTPNVHIGSPTTKLKMPKIKMPKFGFKGPEIDGNVDAPDIDISGAPNVNVKGPHADLDVDISGPSGKFKKPNLNWPNLGLSGPKLDGPNLGLKSPDLDISGSNLSGGIKTPDINVPKIDLNTPKLDLNASNVDLNMPSGKLKMPDFHAPDWDVNAPSGKLKMPKLNLSGTLPKGPNMGLNADMNAPDFNLKAPKMKGGIDAPDWDLPNVDLKAPKFDVNPPDVSIGSPKAKLKKPKLKMPKVNLPSLKGPEIDGNFDVPDVDINAPSLNLKGSKTGFEMPDVEFGSPSGKFKTPHLKLPDVGFSPPKLDGPNFDLRSPDLSVNLPKAPNLKLNSDLNTPELNLKVPKKKGGLDSPKLGLPNMDIKASTLDMHTPDTNIGFPDVNFKKPKIKIPKGPNVDINTGLQGTDLNIPNIDVNSPKGKLKMPSINAPDLHLSGPKAKTPDMDLSGPKLKGPGIKMPDLDLPDTNFKGPKLDLNAKHPDLGINGNTGRPDMNFTGPQLKGGIRGPNFDMNAPLGNIYSPETDLDFEDRKLKFPSFKMPQFGSPDLNRAGSDIDFGASLRPTNLDISPPNAKFNVKPAELKGNVTGPRVSAPNMDIHMPKAAMRNPQLHLKYPDLNVDDPSLNFKGPSYRNRRSDMTGVNMKMPDLDVDADVRLQHTHGRSPRTKGRSSYPVVNDAFGHHIDLHRSDLNIDDFTGKDHVLRARGSNLNLHTPHNYGQVISPSGVNIGMRDPRNTRRIPANLINPNARLPHFSQESSIRVPDSSDGYYVTVFPNQAQNHKMPNRKYNTLGGLDFHPGNLDLEVPDENYIKGSTFFFSNLV